MSLLFIVSGGARAGGGGPALEVDGALERALLVPLRRAGGFSLNRGCAVIGGAGVIASGDHMS